MQERFLSIDILWELDSLLLSGTYNPIKDGVVTASLLVTVRGIVMGWQPVNVKNEKAEGEPAWTQTRYWRGNMERRFPCMPLDVTDAGK